MLALLSLITPRSFIHVAKVPSSALPTQVAVTTEAQCSAAQRLQELRGGQLHDQEIQSQVVHRLPFLSKLDGARQCKWAMLPLCHLALRRL